MRSALLVHRITEDQAAAQARSVWLGLGLLDRAGQRLYDAVLLLDSQGGVALHYRRIQPQWHEWHAHPADYGQSTELPCDETPWGRVAFLICGTLFDDVLG